MSRRTMVLATILMGLSGAKGFAQPGARSPGPDRANATTQGEKAPARPGADASQRNASDLDRFFGPPAEYASDFGSYRSPLEFYDGRPVKNAEEWPARRREILDRWHTIMGPWPPLVEKPAIEYLAEERRDNFTQHHVRLQIAPDRFTDDAYLLKPDGDGPFPAVVVVYYESLTGIGRGKSPLRDFAYQLARRGFVTLSLGSPPSTFYPGERDAQLQPLSFHAYVAANCWQTLAHLPSVDAQRIGIVGHSYGGKWAMFASCLFDKFACAAWSDGGIVFDEKRGNVNYWEPWYLGHEPGKAPRPKGIPSNDKPRTGAYKMLVEQRRDLHELHALMAPRPFLVSGGAEDTPARWQALNHAVAVNKLLGHSNRVAMTNRQGHAPTPESNEQIYLFFEQCLKKSSGGDAQRSARTGDDAERQTFTYKTVGELPILADVYRLPGDDVRPVIVWIHGGGLITGSRGGPRLDQRRRYLDAGYAIVSIDYRLAPETKAAGIVQDVQDAIAWVRTQGPQLFQIDPRRLAVVGHSAGGYLTLMSGFTVKPPPQAL
ncbi:MAG: alpha/beta hydrolase fold domain-containing protein, partial [Pirellulaceae bacterium]